MPRLAAVQEPPIVWDLPGCLERATDIVSRAAAEGVEMLVFPEAWFPGYPEFEWSLTAAGDSAAIGKIYAGLFRNAVDLSRDGLAPLRDAASAHGVEIVAGINERASEQSAGMLYKTVVTIDADGQILNIHRQRPSHMRRRRPLRAPRHLPTDRGLFTEGASQFFRLTPRNRNSSRCPP